MEKRPEINIQLFRDLGESMLLALRDVLTEDEVSLLSETMRFREQPQWVQGVVLRSTVSLSDYNVKASPIHLIHIRNDYDADEPTITLEELEIAEKRRGQGIGTVIVQTFLDFAKERGLDANMNIDLSIEMGKTSHDMTLADERLRKWLKGFGMTPDTETHMEVKADRLPAPQP